MNGCLLWLSEKGAEGKFRLTLIRVGINVRRFATRAWACGERVRCPTILSKIVDKTPDDRGRNRGKPWSIEMLVSFNALCDYRPSLCSTNVRGRRLALAITALRSPPMHRRTALKASLLAFL